METIGVVGLGLVGGSIALALEKKGVHVIAVEPRMSVREAARGRIGEVHEHLTEKLSRCSLVVLAAPVGAIEALLAPVSTVMRDGSILTDVAGVKVGICARARAEVRAGVRFVGSHPMFGGVEGGFAAASAELVSGVGAVIAEGDPPAVDAVCEFWERIGVEPIRCSAEEHDAAMARVSHLPYLLAALLAGHAHPLAGRGFFDATRLARFSFEIQGEVARRNPFLSPAIDELVARLEEAKSALDDPEALRRLLARE